MDKKTSSSLDAIKRVLNETFGEDYEERLAAEKAASHAKWVPPTDEVDPDPFQRTRTLPEDFALRRIEDREKGIAYLEIIDESYREQFTDRSALGEWDQLIWHAAGVTADTGLKIKVFPTGSWSNYVRDWDNYQVSAGWSHAGTHGFLNTWSYLNGMRHGIQAWKDDNQVKEKDESTGS